MWVLVFSKFSSCPGWAGEGGGWGAGGQWVRAGWRAERWAFSATNFYFLIFFLIFFANNFYFPSFLRPIIISWAFLRPISISWTFCNWFLFPTAGHICRAAASQRWISAGRHWQAGPEQACAHLADRPTQLICISHICQQTNTKDIAGMFSSALHDVLDIGIFL